MINWYKNKLREKRLFVSKGQKKQFLDAGSQNLRVALIRQLNTLMLNYQNNELDEVQARKNSLKTQGINPPSNARDCMQKITDLKEWRM